MSKKMPCSVKGHDDILAHIFICSSLWTILKVNTGSILYRIDKDFMEWLILTSKYFRKLTIVQDRHSVDIFTGLSTV